MNPIIVYSMIYGGDKMKRVFGMIEAVFDITYLVGGLALSCAMLAKGYLVGALAGAVLIFGDSFHLIPRILLILTRREKSLTKWLGYGKQITSVTMTVFYLLLWHWSDAVLEPFHGLWVFVFYLLAVLRVLLCFVPQNQWSSPQPPVRWGIIRNIPFFSMGLIIAARLYLQRTLVQGVEWAWLFILLSFAFYLPVVLFANRQPKVGMLMLPKTCMYIMLLIILYTVPT